MYDRVFWAKGLQVYLKVCDIIEGMSCRILETRIIFVYGVLVVTKMSECL